jgi:flagella basal body P-ring formation protein FlgA
MIVYLLALTLIAAPTPERVETAVKSYVESNFAVAEAEYQYDFQRINYASFPSQCDSIRVLRIGKDSPLGSTVFSLGIYADNKLAKTTSTTVDISMIVNALVATVPISTGEQFHDLSVAKRLIKSDIEFPVTDLSRLSGKQTVTYVPAGTMILPTMYENVPVVRPGDRLNIVIEKGFIRVVAQGIARQKGGKGDLIRVANLDSKKIIRAEVVDSLTVACK